MSREPRAERQGGRTDSDSDRNSDETKRGIGDGGTGIRAPSTESRRGEVNEEPQPPAISHRPRGNRPDAAHNAGSLIMGVSMKIEHSVFDFHGAFRLAIPRRPATQGPAGERGTGRARPALPKQSWGGEQSYSRARA